MKIGAPRETFDGEKRVAMTPQSATALKKLGYDCLIETGAGTAARFSDAAYAEAGVTTLSVSPVGATYDHRRAALRTVAEALSASGAGD